MTSDQAHPPGHAPFAVFNHTINVGVVALLRTPVGHHLVSHLVAEITVTGRRTGRSLSLPVFYRQHGNTVRIRVAMPERKLWWRNLRGPGAPVRIVLRRHARSGNAEVEPSTSDRVVVVVHLDPVRDRTPHIRGRRRPQRWRPSRPPNFDVTNGAFHGEGGEALVFAVIAAKILAFAKGAFAQTRNRFSAERST